MAKARGGCCFRHRRCCYLYIVATLGSALTQLCLARQVLEGARRLLANADSIKQAVDLTGASIALDDCYELWDSGFISIPYDFSISDLTPQLRRMLNSGVTEPVAAIDSMEEAEPETAEVNGQVNGHANGQTNGHAVNGDASHGDDVAGGSGEGEGEATGFEASASRSAEETGAPTALPHARRQHLGFHRPLRPWMPRQPAPLARRHRRPALPRPKPLAVARQVMSTGMRLPW